MEFWQVSIISIVGVLGVTGFIKSFYECKKKKNTFGLTYTYRILGAFVWADLVVFGFFWALAATISLLFADWILFLLIVSLFWLVRSIGETIYWFNQQFSPINRNPVKNFKILKNVFHNDSIWFVYQIFWQCMTVGTIITSLYLAKEWLQGF